MADYLDLTHLDAAPDAPPPGKTRIYALADQHVHALDQDAAEQTPTTAADHTSTDHTGLTGINSAGAASGVSYNHTVSGLAATNVQTAIDEEVAARRAAGETVLYTHVCTGAETDLSLGVPPDTHAHYGLTAWVPETGLSLRLNFNVDDVDLDTALDAFQLGQAGPVPDSVETSMLLAEMTVPFYQAATPFGRVWRVRTDAATDSVGQCQISEQPFHAPLTDATTLHLICLDSGTLAPLQFPAGTRVEVRVR